MCLIVFAWQTHPKYSLILAANRDEDYSRPTRPAQSWTAEGYADIIAGKDMKAGGSWFGAKHNGKWAAVTNFRHPDAVKVNPPSRGELVLNYLRSNDTPKRAVEKLSKVGKEFNGVNFLAGNRKSLYNYNNYFDSIIKVEPGVHGLANAVLNSNWPKVKRARQKLEKIIAKEQIEHEALFELLLDDKLATKGLPDTGLPRDVEKKVSSIFIKTERYGTRCSTVMLVHKSGKTELYERVFKPGTSMVQVENQFTFTI